MPDDDAIFPAVEQSIENRLLHVVLLSGIARVARPEPYSAQALLVSRADSYDALTGFCAIDYRTDIVNTIGARVREPVCMFVNFRFDRVKGREITLPLI